MNNLQYLYAVNDDFCNFINHHLVVFEHWYKDDLGDARIDDDNEARDWLMAEHCDSGSDFNNWVLPEPCLRLDHGGYEYASVELGDGTGFVRSDSAYSAIFVLTKDHATARNDRETLQLYANKVSDLLAKAYEMAANFCRAAQKDKVTVGEFEGLQQLYFAMQELGIEV